MINQFKNLVEFLDYFKDEEMCRSSFEQLRFRNGEYCPHCGHTSIYRFKDKRFRCASCRKDFTIKTGTIFGESKVPLRKWFIAIYLLSTSKKGISSIQLGKQVGVTQKTAWFMDHRIREAMKKNRGQLFGGIEVDEKYVGGKEKNKHANKKLHAGRGAKGKVPVMGVIQRGGEARTKVVPNVKMRTVEQTIMENVKLGADVFTDEFASYAKISGFYNHESVNHKKGEYVKGEAHTNTAESFWALFQRGYMGVYHHMSKKHLQRYMNEFSYRWKVKDLDFDEVFSDLVLKVSESGTMKYKALVK